MLVNFVFIFSICSNNAVCVVATVKINCNLYCV